jgi:hypothetical protein
MMTVEERGTMSDRKRNNLPKISTAIVGGFIVRFYGPVPCPHCGHIAVACHVGEHQNGGVRLICQHCHDDVIALECS